MSSSGGGSSTPQNIVTSQNKEPWAGAQPYISQALQGAADIYARGAGYSPYTGQRTANIHPWMSQALAAGTGMASADLGGTAGNQAAQGLAQNIIGSQGLTPGIQNALVGLDNASGLYGTMYGEADTAQNPYLQSMLDAQGRKIADQVNSTMSGAGRYGSGAHTNVLSRNLAEAADPVLAQDYARRQQQKLAALQGQQSVYGQKIDTLGQGINRAGQFAQLTPTLDEAKYQGIDRLAGYGNFGMGYDQQQLNNAINLYNEQQAWEWENAARYAAIANGAGGLGGTTVQTQPNLNMPVGGLQRGLGGALAGAGVGGSVFGPLGAGVGALGGGLLGLL